MAEIINLRESEYKIIKEELADMHEKQLQNINAVMARLRLQVSNPLIFSTDLTSKKIIDILDMISNNVIYPLQQAFQDSEAGVANMITSIMLTDSVSD